MMTESERDEGLGDEFYAMVMAEGLDTAPMCECSCTSKAAPHAARPCGRRASWHVAIHAWGCCNEPDPVAPEAMDERGNLCVVMCGPCARHAEQRAASAARQIAAKLPPGAALECPTCGRPTASAADFVETRPL